MSWSAYATGKPAKARATIEAGFAGSKCAEPEETIRLAAKEVILAALAGQREDSVVQVMASGSMSQSYSEETKKWGEPVTNNLEIKVTSLCVIE
jgi:hypothetical protein